MPNSIPISWLYILCVLGFPVLFHFLQIVLCHLCTLGGWSFLAIYYVCIFPCIFFRMWFSRIMAILNSRGSSSFWYQYLMMVFLWSLSDSKSPQSQKTLLRILADLKCCNFIVSIRSRFLFVITRSGLVAGIRCSVCISKSQRILRVSFSRMVSGLCIYHLVVFSKFYFLQNYLNLSVVLCLIFPFH